MTKKKSVKFDSSPMFKFLYNKGFAVEFTRLPYEKQVEFRYELDQLLDKWFGLSVSEVKKKGENK